MTTIHVIYNDDKSKQQNKKVKRGEMNIGRSQVNMKTSMLFVLDIKQVMYCRHSCKSHCL